MTGMLYKQFAITIAISVVISGVVALTLSPALSALLLKPAPGENRFFGRSRRIRAGDRAIAGASARCAPGPSRSWHASP